MTTNFKTTGQLLFFNLNIDLDKVPIEQLADYTAVEYYLTVEDEPPPDATDLEKIRHYLEAFHHLCNVEDWERANKVLSIRLDTPTHEELHNQLSTWGYYRELINLYSTILGKLNQSWDSVFFHGLGKAYYVLGDYAKAIECNQQSLMLTQESADRIGEGRALGNLGNVYYSLGQYQQAIDYNQQYLLIAREIDDGLAEGQALGNLGNISNSLGDYQLAIDYHQRSLYIALKIGDSLGEGKVLGNLGSAYLSLGDYQQAINYHQQSLCIARYIGDRYSQAINLHSLTLIDRQLGNLNSALEYCDCALSIATELGIPLAKECQELKEKLLSDIPQHE